MSKRTEYILAIVAVIMILVSGIIGYYGNENIKDAGTYVAGVAFFNFFVYKLLTGWLFINLTVKAEYSRVTDLKNDNDHLSVKLTLIKGAIDSLWLDDIEIRICSLQPIRPSPPQFIQPLNFKKLLLTNNAKKWDYWQGLPDGKYVMSTNEETVFSAYTTLNPGISYSAEIVIIGERPFYLLASRKKTQIQWRASLIILPSDK